MVARANAFATAALTATVDTYYLERTKTMTSYHRLLSLAFGLLLSAFCLSGLAHAQSSSATLSGTVLDQNGAVIAGASVTIINLGTRLQREVTTNDEGYFVIPLLPPTIYKLRVQRDGFAPVEINEIVLNIADQKSLQIHLKAGDIKEAVTIESDAVTLNTTDGSVSTVVDQKYVANMPLNGRSFQDLILLTPGVVTQSPQNSGNSFLGGTGEFSVNGERQES